MKDKITANTARNSLKFKIEPKGSVLNIKVGTKRYAIPHACRVRQSDDYVFLSFNSSSEIYQIKDGELRALEDSEDATLAYQQLDPARPKPAAKPELAVPDKLLEALKELPKNVKLAYDANGQIKMVRARNRKR